MPSSLSSNPAQQRLDLLSSHLTPTTNSTTTAMATRDPITCHVLDTTTGRPGASITVTLAPVSSPTTIFHGTTSSDGRITNWTSASVTSSQIPVHDQIKELILSLGLHGGGSGVPAGSSLWKLSFATGEYYGVGKTFFPVVELTFVVNGGEHFHVPLLLGPYSFTTYRGS